MFAYQPTFSMLQLKKDKRMVVSWKSKGVYSSILSPQHTVFLHNIKLFEYKIEIKFDKDPTAKQLCGQNCKCFFIYDLYSWPRNQLNNFTLKNY